MDGCFCLGETVYGPRIPWTGQIEIFENTEEDLVGKRLDEYVVRMNMW